MIESQTGQEAGVMDLTDQDLLRVVSDESALADQAMGSMLGHALACGEALLELQKRHVGEWRCWAQKNVPLCESSIKWYMRAATFRDELQGARSIQDAKRILAAKNLHRSPVSLSPGAPSRFPDATRKMWDTLRVRGLSYTEIGNRTGADQETVRRALNPDRAKAARKREHERRRVAEQAQRGEAEQEREHRRSLAIASGGDLVQAYTTLCTAIGGIEKAAMGCEDDTIIADLALALAEARKAESALTRALTRRAQQRTSVA